MNSMGRPICSKCTRNARTVDTPRVRVRVARVVVFRDSHGLKLRAFCHGDTWDRSLPEGCGEEWIEALHAFGGPR